MTMVISVLVDIKHIKKVKGILRHKFTMKVRPISGSHSISTDAASYCLL